MPADDALVVELRAPGFTHVVFDDRVHGWEAVGEDRSHVPVGPLRQFGDGVFEVVCWDGYSSTDEQGAEEFDAFGIFVRAEGGEWIELLQLELA